MIRFVVASLLVISSGLSSAPARAEDLVIGSLQDLSGPIAALGVHFKNGAQMRFDEENAKGGVHGRTIRFIAEDTAYEPKKAILAAEKLIQRDKVFAVINNLGSPVVLATMPMFLKAGVLHLFPAAPLKEVYEPLHPLKFAMSPSYAAYVPPAARHMIARLGARRVGILYQDDDMGYEVKRGMDELLHQINLDWCEKVSYKRGETDFSSQIARLKAANCDLVVLATVVRETIGAYKEAHRIGWSVPMLVTASGYTAQVHQLGGAEMEGLYGMVLIPHPYADGATPALVAWIERYKKAFAIEPNTWSVMAYAGADIFVRALQQAGPQANAATVAKALERTNVRPDTFGNPAFVLSATDHLALHRVRIAQILGGRWQIVSDFLK